jgi:hypothetical protein
VLKYHGGNLDSGINLLDVSSIQETPNKSNILGFIKLALNQTLEQELDDFVVPVDELSLSSLEILFDLKIFRELGIHTLEVLKSTK